jgi:hypothetical protein
MAKWFKLLFVFFLFCFSAFAQNNVKKKSTLPSRGLNVDSKKEADKFFYEGDFVSALDAYQNIYKIKPDNTDVNFKIGYCYLVTYINKPMSIPFFEFASKKADADENIFYYLGRSYLINNRFDDAFNAFKNAKKKGKHDPILGPDPDKQMEACMNAKYYFNNPIDVTFENLGKQINSPYSEYNPFVTADQSLLIFSSKRKLISEDEEAGQLTSDLYIATQKNDQWQKAKKMDNIINTDYMEESVGLSSDGQKIFIYGDNLSSSGDILTSVLTGKKWSAPNSLGEYINSRKIEKGATMTPDENILYFSSNRNGGYGGFDIYKSQKLPTGDWGIPTNLGPVVNTKYDEDAPLIFPDASTLYFSSTGHESMGGFDIFKTVLDSTNNWSKPLNIGYPINTTDDNLFFSLATNSQYAFISAYRPEGYGDLDIYKVTFNEIKNNNLTVIKGQLAAGDSLDPVLAIINLYDTKNKKKEGIYKPNSSTGIFILIVPSGSYKIEIISEGYTTYTEEFKISEISQPPFLTKKIALKKIK